MPTLVVGALRRLVLTTPAPAAPPAPVEPPLPPAAPPLPPATPPVPPAAEVPPAPVVPPAACPPAPPAPAGLLLEEQAPAVKPAKATTKKNFVIELRIGLVPFTRSSRGGSSCRRSKPCHHRWSSRRCRSSAPCR